MQRATQDFSFLKKRLISGKSIISTPYLGGYYNLRGGRGKNIKQREGGEDGRKQRWSDREM